MQRGVINWLVDQFRIYKRCAKHVVHVYIEEEGTFVARRQMETR